MLDLFVVNISLRNKICNSYMIQIRLRIIETKLYNFTRMINCSYYFLVSTLTISIFWTSVTQGLAPPSQTSEYPSPRRPRTGYSRTQVPPPPPFWNHAVGSMGTWIFIWFLYFECYYWVCNMLLCWMFNGSSSCCNFAIFKYFNLVCSIETSFHN